MPDSIETRLENLLATAEREVQLGFRNATARAAGSGALRSSGHLLTKIGVLGDAMDRFAESATRDAEALERAGHGAEPFYDVAITKLIQLKLRSLDDLRKRSEWAGPSGLTAMMSEAEARYEIARNKLEDHRAGFGRSQPGISHVSIQAGSGSIVQANSPGASAHVSINVGEVGPALASLEAALGTAAIGQQDRAEIDAEIATIRAQLTKPSPSTIVLKESGRTLRSILENLTASAVQPVAWQGGRILWRALGLEG